MAQTALKRAIFDSGRKQIEIASAVEVHESRLSKLANGHVDPTDAERAALSRELGISEDVLFPVVARARQSSSSRRSVNPTASRQEGDPCSR